MPDTCVAYGCTSRAGKPLGVGFYRFPACPEMRELWEKAVARKDWQAKDHSRICGRHFIYGKPNPDPDHPDYVPSVNLDGKCKEGDETHKVDRYERAKRLRLSVMQEVTNTLTPEEESEQIEEVKMYTKEEYIQLKDEIDSLKAEVGSLRDQKLELEQRYEVAVSELHNLKTSANGVIRSAAIKDNDTKTKFYTGLTYHIFTVLFNFLHPFVKRPTKLSCMDELLLMLMKLRLNLETEDLAHRFGVSPATVSRTFHKWLDVMYSRLGECIRWPDKETVRKTLPVAFQKHYPQARCIIDCSEVFIERPTSFKARAQTYSNYKKHNTVKFLIGITPTGVICFLSKCWGGRVSDQELTRSSGFLKLIEPGDTILADRGFLIEEDVAIQGAHLVIPAFTKGKQQLSKHEVELSRQMARVRIHVERVIGILKNRYRILQARLPISLIKRKGDELTATVDKLLTVSAVLTNLGEPIV